MGGGGGDLARSPGSLTGAGELRKIQTKESSLPLQNHRWQPGVHSWGIIAIDAGADLVTIRLHVPPGRPQIPTELPSPLLLYSHVFRSPACRGPHPLIVSYSRDPPTQLDLLSILSWFMRSSRGTGGNREQSIPLEPGSCVSFIIGYSLGVIIRGNC